MKKTGLLCLFIYLSVCTANAQLTGITPNQGNLGQILQTTITSNGLFIQSSSPSGNIYEIELQQGGNTIPVFDFWNGWMFNTQVIDPDTVTTQVVIPVGAVTGLYDLRVTIGDVWQPWWNTVTYTLPGAFTVLPPDGYITGTVYLDLNYNGIQDVGESGISNVSIKVLPSNTLVYTDAGGNYSVPASNGIHSVIYINNTNDYKFVAFGNDTLSATINNGNSPNNNFGLKRTLQSVTPDFGQAGIADTHFIVADEPIFVVGGNPYGNVTGMYVYSTPGFNVGTSAITVIDSVTVRVILTIPAFAQVADSIDIRVSVSGAYAGTHFLYDKFTVTPPDGFITGVVYMDLNNNGIQDVGEPGAPNRSIRLLPNFLNVTTDVNGNYSFNVNNGSYSVTTIQNAGDFMFITSATDTFSVTVSNNTVSGNDFGLKRTLLSITPAHGFQGITSTHQVVADEPIFVVGGNPWGNVSSCRVYSSPQIVISQSNVTVVDSYTILVNISVPLGNPLTTDRDFSVIVTGASAGTHLMKQVFDILPPPVTVSGTLFFDSNQNKINDTGEPRISGGKVKLTPDNSIAFSNNNGEFLLGSLGGPQTLSYENNINGLVVFTDSVTYTFNAVGAITGKDFGFVSSLPDYSIQVSNPYVWPRCNTNQPVSFKIKNLSNSPYNASAWLHYDPLMTYSSSNYPPVSVANDTVHWVINNIPPFTEVLVTANFVLPGAGTMIQLVVNTTSLDSTSTPQLSDFASQEYTIICAMDPNDKQVNPPGIFAQNFTLMGDTLDYLIRFQNTGNDTAFNVVVLDTLDNNLDYSTFEILDNSHSMQTELESNGALRFSFNNIMLPDSNVNEPESHGYIRYRIRALSGLADSTEVINTAYIYFDFNSAVITNTTLNTLVFVLPSGLAEAIEEHGAVLYPNPLHESAVLLFKNPASEKHVLHIVSVTGARVVPEQSTDGTLFIIDGKSLSRGVYFYTLTNTRTQKQYTGKMVID